MPSEFQAVVMAAGKGSRMTELTAKKAKCLLPVGNVPMVWFPLHLLENSGFKEAIVVVSESSKLEVQAALDKCSLKIRIDIFGISESESGEDVGTADSLRSLQEAKKIKCDVIVLSCDLISDVQLAPLLEVFRTHNAALAALFVTQKASSQHLVTPGPKTKDKIERDFLGVTGTTSRMVFIGSASDYEESLPVTQKLLKRSGRVTLHTKLLDTHIYAISKYLCEYLVLNKSLSAIKGELLPHVVKKHLTETRTSDQDKASVVAMDVKTELEQFGKESSLTDKIRLMSTYTDERFKAVYNGDLIRCYAVMAKSYAIRANTLSNYCRVNCEMVQSWENITKKKIVPVSPTAIINSTQLDADTCLIGDKTQIAEKTSIKGSIIGNNVLISPKTQVINSIIMSGAKVGEGCCIQNSILCEECELESYCNLKDCLVGSHHTVTARGKHINEVLTDANRLMEI